MEVCVENLESALAAQNGGATRLELCSFLRDGGLTPTLSMLQQIREHVSLPIFVMIRPKPGNDFLYDEREVTLMLRDMEILGSNGADGFVFGALTADKRIDIDICSKLIKKANALPCTFHRAFDFVKDPYYALEQIIQLGFKRILTSGQEKEAENGVKVIKKLNDLARNRIIIMPGSGISVSNLYFILNITRVKEFHTSGRNRSVYRQNKINDKYLTDNVEVKQLDTIYKQYMSIYS